METGKSSVKQKIIAYFLTIMLIVSFLIIYVTVSKGGQGLKEAQLNKAKIVSANLAIAVRDPVMLGEFEALNSMIANLKDIDKEVDYIIMVGVDGRCMSATDEQLQNTFLDRTDFEKVSLRVKELKMFKHPEKKDVFEIAVPVMLEKEKVGVLRIGYTNKYIAATVNSVIFISTLIGIIALVIGSFIYYYMIQKSIVNPLKQAITLAQKVAEGDLTQTEEVKVKAKNEVGQLIVTFGKLTENLRSLISDISGSSTQTATSSNNLAQISQQSNQTMSQLADTISQITSSTASVAQISKEATTAAGQAGESSSKGTKAIETLVEKMNVVQTSVEGARTSMEELAKRSLQIGDMVKLITKIAEQTNLLSLNAAIEAARAGEAGKGFAVVADEVRKLAESSSNSAQDIQTIIQQIQDETTETVKMIRTGADEVAEGGVLTKEADTMFSAIVSAIDNVTKGIDRISEASEETAAASQEANASTEEQTAALEELSASASDLSDTAKKLQVGVDKFKIEE